MNRAVQQAHRILFCLLLLPVLFSCEAPSIECFSLPVELPGVFLSKDLENAYEEPLSTRRYCVKTPVTYEEEGTEKFPLVIFFHATGSSAWSSLHELLTYADAYGFILVAPDGNLYKKGSRCGLVKDQMCWPEEVYVNAFLKVRSAFDLRDVSVNFDIPFIRKMIDTMKQDYRIDESRIYMAGNSIGAWATYYMAKQFSTEVKAIAPASGGIYLTCPEAWGPNCNLLGGFCYPGEPTGPFNFCDVADCPVPGQGINAENKFAAMILHGEEDPVAPLFNAELAQEQLLSEGHVVETLFLSGWEHDNPFGYYFPEVWNFFESLE